ncbi:kinesin-like protein KIF13B [Eurytemora carolleeae]|uniref:kinesin-like protein KIF13B n=1 Tax=Eurytemora carolleeae TaxID=1294199 RepID=UPI000C7714BA|nr:kinesin-like protein KIF13B [Eurytemora carolleeae]|eukprot:XP_023319966.1 kinesin-like protein KIF13B [Eurytemora affinis]
MTCSPAWLKRSTVLIFTLRQSYYYLLVKYLGCDEGEDKVGVELKMKRGDSDGTFNNKQYFHCAPGFGVLVPLNQILIAWRP